MKRIRLIKNKLSLAIFVILCLIGLTFWNAYGFNLLPQLQTTPKNYKEISRIERSIFYIQQYYYDPQKFDPQKMLEDGLNALSVKIPEMLVQFSNNTPVRLHIFLDDHSETITTNSLTRIFDILEPTSTVFQFINKYYQGDIPKDEQEYAFIGGMLKHLDPHSNILPPKDYDEFKTQTEGEYGGIGIVVGLKDDELTIIAPIEGTPGMQAGLKAEDKIIQIDEYSTINMPLNEAVDLLRGKVNAAVTLKIQRKNKEPFDVTITRKKITINSIHSKLIKENQKNIGIVKVRSFQEDTYRDMGKALTEMQQTQPLQGIVLDFRNNPGGLLDQSLLMADQFLAQGDILYTVGANNQEEQVNKAHPGHDILNIPIIILVNEGTASASEIVAGALKNNNRAIVIGAQSFGKGSVQSLFNLHDGSSLKLTIAQYLTPGRVSIQAVGITPDIALTPVHITDEMFDLRDDKMFNEKSLDEHLENKKYTQKNESFFKLSFLEEEKKEKESEYVAKIDEKNDFPLALATHLLSQTSALNRISMLEHSKNILEQEAKTQDAIITQALSKQAIDWTHPSTNIAQPTTLVFESQFIDKSNQKPVTQITAGHEVQWKITATNRGSQPVFRLIGVVESEGGFVDQREFVFGKIDPNAAITAKVDLKIPESMLTYNEKIKVNFYNNTDLTIAHTDVNLAIEEKQKPELAYTFHIHDNGENGSKGNKNGIPEKGETIALEVNIENLSPHLAKEVIVNLKNLEGDGIFLQKGRAIIGKIPGLSSQKTNLLFDITPTFSKNEMQLEIFSYDTATLAGLEDKIRLPLSLTSPTFDPMPDTMQIIPQIDIRQKTIQHEGKTLYLEGSAQDDSSLKDVTIYSGDKKIFFKAIPKETPSTKMSFASNIPLEEGINLITIHARDNRKMIKKKTLSIMGRPKNDLAQITPPSFTNPNK